MCQLPRPEEEHQRPPAYQPGEPQAGEAELDVADGRYSDLERRVLENFQKLEASNPGVRGGIPLTDLLYLLVERLKEDGLIIIRHEDLGFGSGLSDGTPYYAGLNILTLTEKGREFVQNLNSVMNVRMRCRSMKWLQYTKRAA
jgi:hypothetical protein